MNIKKILTFAAVVGAFWAATAATAATAYSAVKSDNMMLFDSYNRDEITSGKFANEEDITVYWINSTKNNPLVSMDDGAVKLEFEPKGWFAEGAAVKDPDFNYLVIRVKGEKGDEADKITIKFDATNYFMLFSEVTDANGEHPVITTEFTDIVIDVAASGYPVVEKGWEAVHFNSYDEAATVWFDEIYLCKEPPVPSPYSAYNADPNWVPPVEDAPPEGATLDDIAGAAQDFMLFDSYNRDVLSGAAAVFNDDDAEIYWVNWTADVPPVIDDDGVLALTLPPMGWYGEGVQCKDAAHRYVTFRVKGETGGEGDKFTLKLDNGDVFVRFSDLKDGDGNTVAPITTDWQTITFDLVESGYEWEYGFEALHFNTDEEGVTIYIDEIYLSTQPLAADDPYRAKSRYPYSSDGQVKGVLSDGISVPQPRVLTAAFSFSPGMAPPADDSAKPFGVEDAALVVALLALTGGVGLFFWYVMGRKGGSGT